MEIATHPSQLKFTYLNPHKAVESNSLVSMSQGFQQGIFSFANGCDRSSASQDHYHHIAQQSRREKLRVQGFDAGGRPLVAIDEQGEESGVYESTVVTAANNMLSDMFGYPAPPGPTSIDLHANHIFGGYHLPPRPSAMTDFSGNWYGPNRHPATGLSTNSAAAIQLFLMDPSLQQQQQHQRSPSLPPNLHQHLQPHQAFQSSGETPFGRRVVEGQALSLSLSSSLQQLDMAKADDLRVREGQSLTLFNSQQQNHHQQNPTLLLQGQVHGLGGTGVVNMLRNTRYAKPAQELLEEFCSVGRGQLKACRAGKHRNPNSGGGGGDGGASSSTAAAATSSSFTKDVPPLSPADRSEQQRKKTKLISMLDEVERRYTHYCDQMQMVVNCFDSMMGLGAATPYTVLAQRAMSRHFRRLKDNIAAQLKKTCELLGDKGVSSSGLSKGETPRLRLLHQSLRHQRAFNPMGMMKQEAWRPQRGLPEQSVSVLRGWLFEHFLHPYPSDSDKHLLARQTGLSRNQVSNWFINARVRLWKPMVEEMYLQESKDEDEEKERTETSQQRAPSPMQQRQQQQRGQRPEIDAPLESDASPSTSSLTQRNHHRPFASSFENPPPVLAAGVDDGIFAGALDAFFSASNAVQMADMYRHGAAAARMRLGASGDVSLTLGLRHAGGEASDKSRFSVRDLGGC